jgi:hypothetical protein
MLNLVNPELAEGAESLKLIQDFRRVQVSRFPIDVYFIDHNVVKFMDSRFPHAKRIAELSRQVDEKANLYWCLESRLIINDRFVRDNDRRHQKHTKDPKKMLRYLRDYVRPLSTKEIAINSIHLRKEQLDNWRGQAHSVMRDFCNLDRDDVMREMLRMKAIGYKPQTEKFAQVMEQGLPAWEEASRRSKRQVMNVHVFINPDESIEIFCDDKLGYEGINQGVNTYNTLAEAPKCIQQQVAMLRMMEDKAFVPEVGTKVNDTNYWVEVHPE